MPGDAPERTGWWQTAGAVLAGAIVAWGACLLVLLPLVALHLVPFEFADAPGNGWPWRIDSAWSFAADLGPLLALGFVVAGVTCWYLTLRNGVHARRWPLALVAAVVGWIPLGGGRHGLLVVSGGAAFCVMVVAARAWSATERRRMPWSWPLLAALAAAVAVLGAVSISYGALHPLAVSNDNHPPSVALRDGRSGRLDFSIHNRGPAAARILGVALVDGHGLRLTRAQVGGELRGRPRRDEARLPLRPRTIEPGGHLPLFLVVAYPACRHRGTVFETRLRALDVRLRVAGVRRTQRVVLDDPLRVRCRGPASA